MTRFLILLVGTLMTAAKLLGPSGARVVIAENLLLRQQPLMCVDRGAELRTYLPLND